MILRDPIFLLLLPASVLLALYASKKYSGPSIRFSSGEFINSLKPSVKTRLSQKIIYLRIAAFFLIIFAFARPQHALEEVKVETEGIDIVLAIDCSTSMLAEDFTLEGRRVNRLEVVKKVVKEFIEGRKSDRIGLVAFAGRAYTICPLTLDYNWLFTNLGRIEAGIMEDGTAIGSGISSALNRLKNSKSKEKIIILLTDGINNAGNIPPLTAAEASKAIGVKIYTIGAGTKGAVPYPAARDYFGRIVYQNIKIEIDEDVLKKIALETGANYYRATDTESLREIYRQIDRLEKTPIEEKGYTDYKELFPNFLLPGLILLFLEIILSDTAFRRIP